MEGPSLEEESKIKDVRNTFILEKLKAETIDATIKDIRIFFRLENENKAIKDRIIKDIRNIFRIEKENKLIEDIILRDIGNLFKNVEEVNYYKLVRVNNFWSNSYIEYESKGKRNEMLSVEEYLIKIRPHLLRLDHI